MGQRIIVYTDHKNLTYKVFNTERVMRWRLIAEEYGAELRYIKGTHNVVADALSRLNLAPPEKSVCDSTRPVGPDSRLLAEAFPFEDVAADAFPLRLKLLEKEQNNDNQLQNDIRAAPQMYRLHVFRGGGKERRLVTQHGKIVVPKSLQLRIVRWYHTTLCHPGETRTETTIKQHYTWKGLRSTVHDVCTKCHTCQLTKRTKKNYGHLPEKSPEGVPWETLCVDMIGPYVIQRRNSRELKLWCVTMIDPATGWFEIKDVPGTKRADYVSNIVEQTWLNRYPWPQEIIIDRGKEFLAEFAEMVENDYGIKRKQITTRNPQSNAIIERVHQTIGNMLRSFSLSKDKDLIDIDDPWSGILGAIAFAVRSTVHTTARATPMQLVFGRDAILNVQFRANWKYIKERKARIIRANNIKENKRRIPHQYHVGDAILIKNDQRTKYGADAYDGPFEITEVRDNGTVRVRKGRVTDTYNIRMITPYHA